MLRGNHEYRLAGRKGRNRNGKSKMMQRSKKHPEKIVSVKSPDKHQKGRLYIRDRFILDGRSYYATLFPARSIVRGDAVIKDSALADTVTVPVRYVIWNNDVNRFRRAERELLGAALEYGAWIENGFIDRDFNSGTKKFMRVVRAHRKVMDQLKLKGKKLK